jgi:hypothetical protein
LKCREFGSHACEPIGLLIRETLFERKWSAIKIPETVKSLHKSIEIDRLFLGTARVPQHTGARNFAALLRVCVKRPGRRSAKKGDELTPSHARPPPMVGFYKPDDSRI